jgi:hypothetical protein
MFAPETVTMAVGDSNSVSPLKVEFALQECVASFLALPAYARRLEPSAFRLLSLINYIGIDYGLAIIL